MYTSQVFTYLTTDTYLHNTMKDFKRGGFNDRGGDRGNRGGFGGGDRGGNRGGFGGGDRPRFNNKPRFGSRDEGPKEMFPATCSECKRACEVPFRPNGEKPVFCNDCFNAQKESMSGNFAPKPRFENKFERGFDKPRFDRNDRPARDFGPSARPAAPVVDERNNRRIDELKAQVAGLSAQMKEVLAIIGTQTQVSKLPADSKKVPASAAKKTVTASVKKTATATVKPVAKKAVVKKAVVKKKTASKKK